MGAPELREAMISSEVQRTLVKSPPELWSELSDEVALAKHLSEFTAVRIARLQPEERIEWEAKGARGSIVITPSGWGTRVTLTLEREDASPGAPVQPPQAHAPASAAQPIVHDAAPQPADAEPLGPPAPTAAEPEPATTPPAADEPDPTPELSSPAADDTATTADSAAPRRGFFARVVSGWQRALAWAERPGDTPAVVPDPPASDAVDAVAAAAEDPTRPATDAPIPPATDAARASAAHTHAQNAANTPARSDAPAEEARPTADRPLGSANEPREPAPVTFPSPSPSPIPTAPLPQDDASSAESSAAAAQPAIASGEENALSAELREAEEAATEGDTAVLSAVLDSLGSAHHRPFSRA